MPKRSRIRVDTSPVAQRYSDEKIIEFSDSRGNGGLIAFKETDDGVQVQLYRCDPTVTVIGPNREQQ